MHLSRLSSEKQGRFPQETVLLLSDRIGLTNRWLLFLGPRCRCGNAFRVTKAKFPQNSRSHPRHRVKELSVVRNSPRLDHPGFFACGDPCGNQYRNDLRIAVTGDYRIKSRAPRALHGAPHTYSAAAADSAARQLSPRLSDCVHDEDDPICMRAVSTMMATSIRGLRFTG